MGKKSKGKGGKKGKGGGGGGKKGPKPKELELNDMKKGKLKKYILAIYKEIDREREERNFFMLEREKLFLFWNMLLEQIVIEKEKARLQAIQYDEAEREKEKDMNTYKQKLRALMSEQTQKFSQARLMNLWSMKRVQDEIWEIMMMLREPMLDKHQQWRHAQRNLYDILQNLQLGHADEITKLREEFATEIKRMSEESERKNDAERKKIDVKNAKELAVIRTEKEKQLSHMLHMHEKQLLGMKTYFNDLEVNNMAVINALQQEVALKKLAMRRLQRSLKKTKEKYESLVAEDEEIEMKMLEWSGDQNEVEKIQQEIQAGQNQLDQNNRYIRLMSSANEALIQKTVYVKKERDGLRSCFAKCIINSQMKSTMQRMVTGMRTRAGETDFNFEQKQICPPLQPIFNYPPFKFNRCVFPTDADGPLPRCRIPIRNRGGYGGFGSCQEIPGEGISTPLFLPPLRQNEECEE